MLERGGLGCEFCKYGPGYAFFKVNDIIFIDVGIFYNNQKIGIGYGRVFRQLAAVHRESGNDQQLACVFTVGWRPAGGRDKNYCTGCGLTAVCKRVHCSFCYTSFSENRVRRFCCRRCSEYNMRRSYFSARIWRNCFKH